MSDPGWFEREQLHFAAADGDIDRVKALVVAGAPVDTFDELGFTRGKRKICAAV